jgi:hypothetical protein
VIRHFVARAPLDEALDLAVTRNARFVTALRHTTAKLHMSGALGHAHTLSWVACSHEDCRKVAALLGDLKPPPPPVPTR